MGAKESPQVEGKKKKPGKKSSFIMFCQETWPMIKTENPDFGFGDITKMQGNMWKKMSENEKEGYKKKADIANEEKKKADAANEEKMKGAHASNEDEPPTALNKEANDTPKSRGGKKNKPPRVTSFIVF